VVLDDDTTGGYDLYMITTGSETNDDLSAFSESDEAGDGHGQQALRMSTSYAHDKAKIMARLRRMEGQVRGVQRMVEEGQYCLDVLTQLSAIIAAARQTGLLVLEDHVRGCVLGSEHAQDEIDREELLTELIGAIDRFGRSVG
jgi:CsoR family transcriptional regulator, copper-sensing transcriptional repressor